MKGAIFQAVGEAMKSIRLDLEEKIKNIPDEDLVVFRKLPEIVVHNVMSKGIDRWRFCSRNSSF